MGFIEIEDVSSELTQRQRYSHYFALVFGALGLLIGINLRASALGATIQYVNTEAGIRSFYPENWLLDADSNDYIFRIQDMRQTGFKTTIQVATRPVSPETSTRNVLEAFSLTRSQTLAAYDVLAIEPYALPDQQEATAMSYTYVASGDAPFLQSIPTVVRGLDILTIARGEAIVITFQDEADTYDGNFVIFEQFLRDLEF